jgi:hypothetical protein
MVWGVLEQEVDKCRRLFYDLQAHEVCTQAHGKRRYNAKKMKDEGESQLLSFKSMYASG